MDVGTWLRGLGLGQYEQTFRDNDVDAEVLPELTADDLIGLGVASIGHRRKLLAALAALRKGTSAPEIPPAQAEPAPSVAGRRPGHGPPRRRRPPPPPPPGAPQRRGGGTPRFFSSPSSARPPCPPAST